MKKFNKQILEAINKGIKLALDDYQDMSDNSSVQSNNIIDPEDVIQKRIDICNSLVDLGLPSGTLWCKFNIGAKPIMKQTEENWYEAPKSWYGDYFAFGETEPKEIYTYTTYKWIIDENSYKHSEFMKKYYHPGWKYKNIDLCDDAAYVNTNGKFKMPTKEQYEELMQNCDIKRVMHYNDIGGLNGRLFTSKINGEQLFFTEADIKTNIEHQEFNLHQNHCNICYYWTSSLYSCNGGDTCSPEALMISDGSGSTYAFVSSQCHANGLPIRGVLNKR